MVGANYMGGKRNAFKTRSKNPTLRAQKAFFGRQRLGLNSKPQLSATLLSDDLPTDIKINGRPKITLKHAYRQEDINIDSEPSSVGFIPGPSPFKPPISLLIELESGTRQSDILRELDETQPLFIRATLDKALGMRDLAGLYHLPVILKEPSSASRMTLGCGFKRKRSEEHDENKHPNIHSKRQLRWPAKMDECSQHPSSSWRIHLQPEARPYETKINSMHSPTELKPSSFRPNNLSYSSPSSSLPGSSVPSCHDSDFTTASSPSTLGLRHPGYSRSSPRVSDFFTATSSTLNFDEQVDDPSAWEAPNLVGYSSSQMLSDPPYIEEPFDLQLQSVSPENLLYQPDPWKALDDLLDLRPEVLVRQNDNDSIPAVHSSPVPDFEVDIFKRTGSDIQCDESDVENHAVLSNPVLDCLADSATSNMVPAQDGLQDFSSSPSSPSMSFINDQDLSDYSPMHLNDRDQPQPGHATDSGSPPRHIKLSHRLPRYFEDDEHLEIEVEPPRYITSASGNPNKDSSCLDSGHMSEYGSPNGPPGHPAVQGPNVDDGVSLRPQVKAVSSPRDSEPLERHVTFSSPPTTMSSLHDVVVPEPDTRLALRSNTNRVLRKEGDFYVGPCLFFDDFDDDED